MKDDEHDDEGKYKGHVMEKNLETEGKAKLSRAHR